MRRDSNSVICIAEDRPDCAIGVKLLVLSLRQHGCRLPIHLRFPKADDGFARWAAGVPDLTLVTEPIAGAVSFNVKPAAILHCFALGFESVVWIDSDIIVIDDRIDLAALAQSGRLVLCEEPAVSQRPGSAERTRAWGLEIGRPLPFTVNAGLLICNRSHIALIERWRDLLNDPHYRASQKLAWHRRPLHFLGDQDVLTALVGSAQFRRLDHLLLRSGPDILQCFGPAGYLPSHRVRNASGGRACFVHAMGRKPWAYPRTPNMLSAPRAYYDALHSELSPYTIHAKRLLAAHRLPCPDWAARRTILGSLCKSVSGGHPSLAGLPIAMVDRAVRLTFRALRINRMRGAA